jgi:hypothetical protein
MRPDRTNSLHGGGGVPVPHATTIRDHLERPPADAGRVVAIHVWRGVGLELSQKLNRRPLQSDEWMALDTPLRARQTRKSQFGLDGPWVAALLSPLPGR